MTPWWQGVGDDFSDLSNLAELLRVGVRLLLAAVLGGLLGLERAWAGKEPGPRTHMLLALGAAFFVVIPQQAACPTPTSAAWCRGWWPASASSAPAPSSRGTTGRTCAA